MGLASCFWLAALCLQLLASVLLGWLPLPSVLLLTLNSASLLLGAWPVAGGGWRVFRVVLRLRPSPPVGFEAGPGTGLLKKVLQPGRIQDAPRCSRTRIACRMSYVAR